MFASPEPVFPSFFGQNREATEVPKAIVVGGHHLTGELAFADRRAGRRDGRNRFFGGHFPCLRRKDRTGITPVFHYLSFGQVLGIKLNGGPLLVLGQGIIEGVSIID